MSLRDPDEMTPGRAQRQVACSPGLVPRGWLTLPFPLVDTVSPGRSERMTPRHRPQPSRPGSRTLRPTFDEPRRSHRQPSAASGRPDLNAGRPGPLAADPGSRIRLGTGCQATAWWRSWRTATRRRPAVLGLDELADSVETESSERAVADGRDNLSERVPILGKEGTHGAEVRAAGPGPGDQGLGRVS